MYAFRYSVRYKQHTHTHTHTCMHTHTHTHSRATDEESQSLFGDSEVPDPFAPGAGDPRTEQSLWVDKYSPRNFTELLSDDVRPFGSTFMEKGEEDRRGGGGGGSSSVCKVGACW